MRRLTGWILLFDRSVFINFQVILRTYIPRILHPRLGCRRQTADLSLLQGKGRLKANVQESVCSFLCLIYCYQSSLLQQLLKFPSQF